MVVAILRYAQLVAVYSTFVTAVLSVNSTNETSSVLEPTRSVTLDDLVSDPTPKAKQECSVVALYPWDNFKYACVRTPSSAGAKREGQNTYERRIRLGHPVYGYESAPDMLAVFESKGFFVASEGVYPDIKQSNTRERINLG